MNTVWNFFSDATWQTLATALLHTLWQGVLISFVLFFCLKLLPTNRPRARYAASLTAMLCLLLGSLATWATLDYFATEREAAPARTVIFVPAQSETSASAASATVSGESHSIASIPEPGSTPDTQQSWDYRPLILLAWLTGVGLMLIRLVNQLKATGHLDQQCRSLDNPELIRMTEELRRALGISRRVRLLITEKLTSPAAVGALWPIILLPASLATGTPPETIRAILAHELAHIRRHDYVINLAQMLIETVLFFNPAVWWISRQIRIEREACCDKLAVQISGDDIQYAQALSDFASKHGLSVGLPMPAMAFGQERSPGSLLDRVKRILIPGYQPHLRLPWLGMFTFLLIGGLTLFALQQGTQLAVTATAKLLTPKERIEKIEQIQKTHSVKKPYAEFTKEQLSAPDSKVTVSGIVRMDDGSPFDQRKFQFHVSSQQPNYSAGYTFSVNKDNTFSTKVRPGNIYLTTRSEDYAPTFVGPLDGKPGAVIEDVEIVLSPGFESSIQVMDATGRPIAGARFKGRYDFPDGVALPELVSDERGRIELANCAPLPAKLELWVEGYQHDYRVETFLPEQTVQWSLKKGVSTR